MEEQRLAACAEKLKRLNEKHRQTNESKLSSSQTTSDEAGAAGEEALSPIPASSPVSLVPVSQSQALITQGPLLERVDRDKDEMEQEREKVEPSAEDETQLPCQPSPPPQRPTTLAPEPQSEGETLAEVGPLVEENQTDKTASVPICDYFNTEDHKGKLALGTFLQVEGKFNFLLGVEAKYFFLQWMSPTCLCLTWKLPEEKKSPLHLHNWREKLLLPCVPL